MKLLEKRAAEKPAMTAVEKRLTCEGLLGTSARTSHHQPGIYDDAMRIAVRRFQQKHMIYEANFLRRKTVEALSRSLLDNDYDALVRALRERVVSAAEIVEDGSASKARNLVDEYTKVTLDQLGLTDGAAALAFFKRHDKNELKTLRVAVKLPPRPDYYAPDMDLSIVVDRGDVWYDVPFDDKGHYKPQTRKKYPSLTLYTKVGGKQVALARWRTTIGGWRADQASNGYEYFRYKGSDVGPRVIRHIVSGPVWIAPASTPIRSLVKGKLVNGKWMSVVNYDELGPGYLSAYGLIAGYFVVPGQNGRNDFDNGVRAHGSSDYLSIYSANGYSHGCHRLPNHLAIRLYSFILRHRHMKVSGDQPMGFTRQFLWKNTVYEMRIPSRGYLYEMDPPVPVNVLEGNIMGDVEEADPRLRPRALEQVPARPAAGGADDRRQGRRRQLLRRVVDQGRGRGDHRRAGDLRAGAVRPARRLRRRRRASGRRGGPTGAGRRTFAERAHRLHHRAVHQEGDGLLGEEAARHHRAARAADRHPPARLGPARRGREVRRLRDRPDPRLHLRRQQGRREADRARREEHACSATAKSFRPTGARRPGGGPDGGMP